MADPPSRLSDFAGWGDPPVAASERFVQYGLVVLDANVLLSLYRIAPGPQREVLSALAEVGDRLWVPHQAALEFSRNRQDAVAERIRSFAEVEQALTAAPQQAMAALHVALGQFRHLRERSGPAGPDVGVDSEDLLSRLHLAMAPVLAQLRQLADEYEPSSVDTVLPRLDPLLAGRIGPGYPSARLHQLVAEAVSFRYPNEIPPGFRDDVKDTPIRQAGDFLLWQQIIDRVAEAGPGHRLVLLVTNDLKDDWWEYGPTGVRVGARPELVQELRDRTGADLLLRTLDEFLLDVRNHLPVRVSAETIDALHPALTDSMDT